MPQKGEKIPQKIIGSGRKPGSLNKSKVELAEKARELGVDPFEVILYFAKGDHKALNIKEPITTDQRLKAATEACHYLYVKRTGITAEGTMEFRVVIEDYTKKEDK